MNKEKIARWGFLIFIIIPVLIYIPYYLKGEIPGNADLVQYFSNKVWFAEQLLKGEFVEWNRYLVGGMPQNSGLGYLPVMLLSLFPLREYIYLCFIFHLFIGSFFFYLYLRENHCSYLVSMVMGVIYECSIQINGLRKSHPSVIISICLFPVIMYLLKKFFNTRQPRWLYVSAIIAAVQATAMQQYSIYADLVLVIYIVAFCIHGKFKVSDIIKKGVAWVMIYVGIFAYVLFPTLSLISEYTKYGSSAISYETFSSYSVHPIKIIQMIIPKFFGDVYQSMGRYYSSEMDIEMYLGIFVLLLVISVMIKCRNKVEIRIEFLCAIFAFLYAAIAHIPVLNHIIHRLPVLGGFRCAGRMLYIFYFFMLSLAGRGLENLTGGVSGEEQGVLIKKMAKALFVGVVCLSIVGTFAIFLLASGEQSQYCYKLKDALLAPLVYSGIIAVILWFILLKKNYKWGFISKWKPYLMCVFVLVVTLAEVLPYSLVTQPLDVTELYSTDEALIKMKESAGDYKVWDAFNSVDCSHNSIISQNKNQIREIPAINAYTVYNNPLVVRYFKNLSSGNTPFNYSGLLTGSCNAYNNLIFQNDLLSMMGVKYLIDSSGIIENTGGITYNSDCETNQIFLKENVNLTFDASGVGVSEIMSGIQGNTCYKVTFTVDEEDNKQLSFLAADLYGGESYDLASQEKQFFIAQDGNEYVAYLFSDYAEQATQDICIRILAKSATGKVQIDRCEIAVVSPLSGYTYWGSDAAGTKIYENVNAKDILYFPSRVTQKKNFDDMYDNYEKYDLAQIAYVDRESREYQDVQSNVNVLSYENNSITAEVTSDADTYLCFSQNYSPHWSVEVDGSEQEVDMVNGLIMGTNIPKGAHMVVFKYHNNAHVIGCLITGITIITLILCYIVGRQGQKNQICKKSA